MEAQISTGTESIVLDLTSLWRKLLSRDVGPDDDFFDSGGDSLRAITMIMEVQSTYGIELDVETFFEHPTIRRLADVIVIQRADSR